jgi:hypothetical protein
MQAAGQTADKARSANALAAWPLPRRRGLNISSFDACLADIQ